MQTAALSKKGLRNENQDSYFIDENRGIFIVADGMGGHNAGQIASSIAIKSASTYFIEAYHKYKRKDDLVLDALVNANKQILEHAKYNPDTSGMGTTMTFVYIDKGLAYIGHIGDSRAYLVNTNNIIQLTNDHSYVGELVRAGGLSEEDALKHPKRNLLTRALG
jgi:serine/threonine protein phosphatase PrpC